MKKFLLICISVFVVKSSFSQTEKGNKFVGGDINLSGNNYSFLSGSSNISSNSLNFSPEFGFFIKDNFAIGFTGNFGFLRQYIPQNSVNANYGTGVFVRNFFKLNDNFKFFINSEIDYLYSKSTIKYNNESVSNSLGVNFSPGLIYFATKKMAVTSTIGQIYYRFVNFKSKNQSYNYPVNNSSYGINLNNACLNLGVNYYF